MIAVSLDVLAALVVFAFLMSVTPGPNNVMLMTSGSIFGLRATAPHILGIICGFALLSVGSVFGLNAILEQLPWLTLSIRLIGTAWLVWLGVTFVRAGRAPSASAHGLSVAQSSRPIRFHEALLFQWANPKALVAATSCASAFVGLSPIVATRAAVIGVTFFICGAITSVMWTTAGTLLSRLLTTGARARYAQLAMGFFLIVTALSLLLI